MSNLFPSLRESSPKLELSYRDEDGDQVTLSSDEEVAAALSTIAMDKTWRLQARQIRPATTKTSFNPLLFPFLGAGRLSPSSGLHRLLDPFSFDNHDSFLTESLGLFEKLRLAEQKASAEHRAAQQKQAQQEATESKGQQQHGQDKTAEKEAQESSSTTGPSPSCRVSWSPGVSGCPFWSSSMLGPFGYEIRLSWAPGTNQENQPKTHPGNQPGTNDNQPEPAKESQEEEKPTEDQPLEEPQKEEEARSEEPVPTAPESVSA